MICFVLSTFQCFRSTRIATWLFAASGFRVWYLRWCNDALPAFTSRRAERHFHIAHLDAPLSWMTILFSDWFRLTESDKIEVRARYFNVAVGLSFVAQPHHGSQAPVNTEGNTSTASACLIRTLTVGLLVRACLLPQVPLLQTLAIPQAYVTLK
jgi:hypothetical protein